MIIKAEYAVLIFDIMLILVVVILSQILIIFCPYVFIIQRSGVNMTAVDFIDHLYIIDGINIDNSKGENKMEHSMKSVRLLHAVRMEWNHPSIVRCLVPSKSG